MSSRFVYGLRLRQLTPSSFSSRARHLPSSSRSSTATLSFDPSTYAPASSHPPSPTDSLVAAKARDLLSSLERGDSNSSRPWSHYVDLLNYMGLERLPLEVHQLVLRKCVPPARVLRAASKRERRTRHHPHAPHIYENRLQTVMKNIRSAGWQADLDDYHFVLEQFAAVGHYIGSRGVLQEMAFAGVQPSAKTYRLCLQALAFRLSLPCSEERRPILIEETTKMAREVTRDMRSRDLPLEAVDTDLAIRIFRETVDEKGFAELLKFSYGIDLAYPDRLPLEVVERPSTSKVETSEELDPPLHRLQPLSTPALNVIIDMLGRSGRISKMVQAFEVLTQPLPKSYQSPPSLFDEDEDDFSFNPPSVPEPIYPLPSAPPNSTTFQLLIKHASIAGHAVFARHYLVYALRTDRAEDRRIKRGLSTVPVDEIAPPRLAVNRNMFLPVFGLSNRERRIELMSWTLRMIRRTLRRKRKDLFWYTFRRATQYGQEMSPGVVDIPPSTDTSSEGDVFRGVSESTSSASSLLETSVVSPARISTAASTISTSNPNSPPAPLAAPSAAHPSHRESRISILDLDLDSDRSTPLPRIFNIDAHIYHLQRDIQQLELLDSIVVTALGRIIDRIKERLGRRVWSGKNVWLADERTRVPVTKEFWKKAVNFVAPEETKLRGQSRT
ncbi:hypothetical protein F5888DRAFT_445219 [Russula emetica]|nr:hypothetical protein F5888DRAFT_445219 [Russula emetica]